MLRKCKPEKREDDAIEVSKKLDEIKGFKVSFMEELVKKGRKFEDMDNYHVTKKYGAKR